MAPEQLRDESTDERSDLYSLGIVLYEMLTGVPPFVADTEYGLMQAQINAKPQRLRNLIPHADARLEAVLNRALAKRQAQQGTWMTEFRDAISDCGADAHVAIGFPGGDPSNPATKVRGAILDRLSLSTAAYFFHACGGGSGCGRIPDLGASWRSTRRNPSRFSRLQPTIPPCQPCNHRKMRMSRSEMTPRNIRLRSRRQ